MGMTLWIHTLEGRNLNKESDDHTLMHDLSDELDKLCEELKVTQISNFFDTTDLEHNNEEDLSDDDWDEESEMDPETGWAYGIDDMQWFDAVEGQATLTALRDHVAQHNPLELDPKSQQQLVEELDDCLAQLTEPAKSGGMFHLAVIM